MKARPIYDIEVSPFAETIHAGEMYERLFSGVFGRELEGRPYFDMPPSPENESSRIVGINCGGRGSKRWPLDSFIEVGQRLASEGYEIEFILGPDEAHLRQGLERSLPDGCRLLPYLPLPELMSKMRAHQLFISSDTGPMHLAWCLGVPVIAIFIDSELPKFKPLSAGSEALDGKSGLSPQIVVEKALSILKSRSVPA
jgi:ADP-heptose:LPS heptosyltransferase